MSSPHTHKVVRRIRLQDVYKVPRALRMPPKCSNVPCERARYTNVSVVRDVRRMEYHRQPVCPLLSSLRYSHHAALSHSRIWTKYGQGSIDKLDERRFFYCQLPTMHFYPRCFLVRLPVSSGTPQPWPDFFSFTYVDYGGVGVSNLSFAKFTDSRLLQRTALRRFLHCLCSPKAFLCAASVYHLRIRNHGFYWVCCPSYSLIVIGILTSTWIWSQNHKLPCHVCGLKPLPRPCLWSFCRKVWEVLHHGILHFRNDRSTCPCC